MFFSKKYLVADMGGTNARFAIIEKQRIIAQTVIQGAEFPDFLLALKHVLELSEFKKHKLTAACFAIAGPINADRTEAAFTNSSWIVNVSHIQKQFHFNRVLLINDFEAIGFAIPTLQEGQYVEITNHGRNKEGTKAIIGAGTGLGAGILPAGEKPIPLPSEGGHIDVLLKPDNVLERQLYLYMKKNNIALEAESLVSGRGIALAYQFLMSKQTKKNKKIAVKIAQAPSDQKPALITSYALQDRDTVCLKATELFVRMYARAARTLSIITLPSEVIIAGGIAPKIIPIMQELFVGEFCDREQSFIKSMLETRPILIIIDEQIAFYGAANALGY